MIFKQAALHTTLALCFVAPSSMADAATTILERPQRHLKSDKGNKTSKNAKGVPRSPIAPTAAQSPAPSAAPTVAPSAAPSMNELRLVQYSDSKCNSENGVSSVIQSFASNKKIFTTIYRDNNDTKLLRKYYGCSNFIALDGSTLHVTAHGWKTQCPIEDENDSCLKHFLEDSNLGLHFLKFPGGIFTTDSCVGLGLGLGPNGDPPMHFKIEGPEDEVEAYWDTLFDNSYLFRYLQREWTDEPSPLPSSDDEEDIEV